MCFFFTTKKIKINTNKFVESFATSMQYTLKNMLQKNITNKANEDESVVPLNPDEPIWANIFMDSYETRVYEWGKTVHVYKKSYIELKTKLSQLLKDFSFKKTTLESIENLIVADLVNYVMTCLGIEKQTDNLFSDYGVINFDTKDQLERDILSSYFAAEIIKVLDNTDMSSIIAKTIEKYLQAPIDLECQLLEQQIIREKKFAAAGVADLTMKIR